MVMEKAEVPWRFQRRHGVCLRECSIRLVIVFREANVVADFLASYAVRTGCFTDFSVNGILPLDGSVLLIWKCYQNGLWLGCVDLWWSAGLSA
ncbi:unnamed protein product [Ilex paraguariensis]|uniref:RNase H type-1 domain-containing protein n=1 Tax=Ilex paraguariensis TaxID=185542 RepID=A0ABC8QZ08_9AQUA